jgi:hypothetical protein
MDVTAEMAAGKIDQETVNNMHWWTHSGFSRGESMRRIT